MESAAGAIVVTPTLNERENIGAHVRDVFETAPDISMLVVDDGSRDGTSEEVEGLRASRHPRLHLLERKGQPSFGGSYRDGFAWAIEKGFDLLLTMDADRSHPASAIPAMIRAAGVADLVVASRYVQGISVRNWPLRRVLLSVVAVGVARGRILSLPRRDRPSRHRRSVVRLRLCLTDRNEIPGLAGGSPHPRGSLYVRRTARRNVEDERKASCRRRGRPAVLSRGPRPPLSRHPRDASRPRRDLTLRQADCFRHDLVAGRSICGMTGGR
jgi:glycosyltransferase involved in cell wall biosynthesis